ncbi:putative ATP-dependent protease (CrgA) [Aspergillus undulatus]|uniref:putative ATP-dependent protease (CrgA) n=1 Tax=Aspergillus undulatus TaxID=1810928 RepID=UPI003CCD0BB1
MTSRDKTPSSKSSNSDSEPSTPRIRANRTDDTPHAIVRLIQCSRCSLPFRIPLRLPCGDTLCRSCLPPVRPRIGVSYPASEDRKQGFTCSWGSGTGDCRADHCLGDCGVDVTLTRLVGVFDEVLGVGEDETETARGAAAASIESWQETQSAEVGLDLLKGVYDLVRRGQLDYNASGIRYEQPVHAGGEKTICTLDRLRAVVRNELDCQVCYSLIVDPLTTPCGHTFCRSCVAMALAHSNLCPICRRKLNMSSSIWSERINKRLSGLIETLLPDEVASRRADFPTDIDVDEGGEMPLAVVSLSFPTMPLGLHIFEPRYRLMIQRVMENRGRKFGMVMPNRRGRLQSGLGRAPFMQYGTILAINRHELLPDGRSLLIATGTSRFKVLSWELVDGYHLGKIQRVNDVSISEEEAQESRETAAMNGSSGGNVDRSIDSMSTQELFQLALDFVLKERRQGAPWLHPRVLLAYGALPTDPALFPWWFATILPSWDEEKYALLTTTTVRQRLKITAGWIKRLESRTVPLLVFTIISWFIGPRATDSGSPGVATSFTPFGMSVSIYLGPGGTVTHFGNSGLVTTDGSESYLSQTLVLGLFLAIFATQMTVNIAQAPCGLAHRSLQNMPPLSDSVTISNAEYQQLLETARQFTKLKDSLMSGGLSQATLDLILYGAPSSPEAHENEKEEPVQSHTPSNGYSKPLVAKPPERQPTFATELDDDEGGLTDSHSDERDDYGESSRSASSSPQTEQRTVLIRGLPDKTTHRDIVDAVKGGAILHIYVWARDKIASVSFVEESAAQDFLDHTRTYGLYVADKRVEVLWNDRQFYLPPFVRSKIGNGASRNLVIYNVNPNISEGLIRKDMEHIHNLIVISVKFKHGNAYISTNSVHNALFARSCMMSRLTYKGMKIAFYPDECAEPLSKMSAGPKREAVVSKKPAALPNRFHLLSIDGSDDEESELNASLHGGVCWTDNSVSA